MKGTRLVLAASVLAVAASAAIAASPAHPGGLRPPLNDVLAAAPPDALVPVSVVLVEQVSSERLRSLGAGLARRDARPVRLNALKETARRTQAPLLALLRELEGRGQAARIRPLWIGNVVGVDATPAAIRAIASRPEVAWVNHNPKTDVLLENFSPDPSAPRLAYPPAWERAPELNEIECGVTQMRAPEVWSDFGNTGEGAVIAVVDTGVCWTHSDIANQMWVNPGEDLDHDGVVMDAGDVNGLDDDENGFVDDFIGWDFDNNDRQPDDVNSHGSHCAGTVAGDGTAGTQAGMAPDAKIMAVRVGVNFSDEVDVWNGMQYAADNGADAISMSLGWPHGQNPDRATWRQNAENTIDAGTAMVIAAGNEGEGFEPDNVRTPGDVPRVITVGAVDCLDVAAGFSSRGPVTWQDVPEYGDHPFPPGLTKPDISAPGVNTKSHNVCSGYSFKSGTSMATPHVAGAVALMIAASPGLGNDDIKEILEETAIDLGALGKDNTYGSGRVDAYAAVQNIANPNGRINVRELAASCNGVVTVQVSDSDLKGAGTLAIEVYSSSEAVPESLVLTETGPTSGVFRGEIATDGGPVAADGQVQVGNGDTITARYVDANDGEGGLNVVKTDTAIADCQGPIISLIGESGITDVSATIQWQTDEASSSLVHWGQARPPTSQSSTGGNSTSHSVPLTGLQSCTVYYYSVSSTDGPGNTALDTNGGAYHYFETYGNFGDGLQPCHAGRLTVADGIVSCTDSVPLKVVDLDLNLDALAPDTVVVTVSSTTEVVPENVVLTESGPNTSQFVGAIPTAPGAAVPGDGVLQVAGGDVVSATYHDADDGTGVTAVSFDSSDLDCAGPGLSNVTVVNLTDEGASVRWNTSEPSSSRVDWGTTPALGNVVTDGTLKTFHELAIGPFNECGRIHFRVTSTDIHGNIRVGDANGSPYAFSVSRIPGIFRDEFEALAGWTLEGEWQIGAPQGKGVDPPDPTTAYTGTKVLGHDLTGLGPNPGDYEPTTTQSAISPVINASTLVNGQLRFRRWLNTAGGGIGYIDVKTGSTWNNVWSSPGVGGLSEFSWTSQTVSIAPHANGNAALQIRFRQYGGFAAGAHHSGWNVDRLVIHDAAGPDFLACGGCGGVPTFAGLAAASDVSGCADTGVSLSWPAAPAWGTGNGGGYAVYRSTDPAFVPSPGSLVASGLAGTAYTDVTAPNGVALYYIVRAENDETCSSGPDHGGVTDTNLVRVSARDDVTQPAPGDVGSTLAVAGVNDAQVRVTWSPTATAARYHVYRADTPQGPFVKLAEVAGTLFDDRDELGNLNPRSYRVKAADSCGNEGP